MALPWAALACASMVQGQQTADEAEIKAAFVYNFLKFVEWPATAFDRPDQPLVVAVLGSGPTADAAERLLGGTKTIGERPLVVRRIAWDAPLTGIHAVFVTGVEPNKVRRILAACAVGKILSIGDGPGFASSGGVIGLVIEERRVRFDVDTDVAEAAGLKVSSKLLRLRRVIHSSVGDTADLPSGLRS